MKNRQVICGIDTVNRLYNTSAVYVVIISVYYTGTSMIILFALFYIYSKNFVNKSLKNYNYVLFIFISNCLCVLIFKEK